MSRVFEIVLGLPPKGCSSNARGVHWGKKARAAKSYREEGRIGAMCAMKGQKVLASRAVITAEFFLGNKVRFPVELFDRPRDEQNAISDLKAAIDGFVDAGLLKGDTKKVLTWGAPPVVIHSTIEAHKGLGKVVVRVEVIEE